MFRIPEIPNFYTIIYMVCTPCIVLHILEIHLCKYNKSTTTCFITIKTHEEVTFLLLNHGEE